MTDNENVQSPDFEDLDLKPEVINTENIKEMQHSDKNKDIGLPNLAATGKRNKVPRRVIHFSDGVVEEFSTDSEEEEERKKAEELEKGKVNLWKASGEPPLMQFYRAEL